MNVIITVIIFIVMLAVLVLVHEFGHFIAAKKSGVRVDEFGFGFPPRLFGKKIGETVYSLNLLPLGGFVKVFGEDSEDAEDLRSFVRKPFYIKIFILLAGVLMNFLLAVILFSVVQIIGVPTGIDDSVKAPNAKIFINAVARGSPSQVAGLHANDILQAIYTTQGIVYLHTLEETQQTIKNNAGSATTFIIVRGAKTFEVTMTPRQNPPPGEGALGVELLRATNFSYPWYEAPWRGFWVTFATTLTMIMAFVTLFQQMFATHTISADIAGPVGIARLTGQMTALGLSHLLQFAAIISLNLAILNALPFPALDGGRAFILILEKIRRRDFSARTIQLVNSVGFAVLITFVLFVTIRDIEKLI